MGSNLQLFPTEASTVAGPVDTLVLVILGLALFIAFGVAALIVVFVIKYRRRADGEVPSPTGGSHRLEFAFITVPLLLALVVYYFASRLYLTEETPPPTGPRTLVLPAFVNAHDHARPTASSFGAIGMPLESWILRSALGTPVSI